MVSLWRKEERRSDRRQPCRIAPCALPLLLAVALVLAAGQVSSASAGVWLFAGDPAFSLDVVTHPTGYDGTGGTLQVSVCVDPASPLADRMQAAAFNVAATYTALMPTTGNIVFGNDRDLPSSDQFDFESVALHEVGHCLGLGHPNLSNESGLVGSDTNYTNTTKGGNGVFDLDDGPDDVIGSSDDLRGDDDNLHWFQKSVNNPFTLPSIVDSTTYSRLLSDLPGGHSFAANADRDVGALLGVPDTEAVMQQLILNGESRRTLAADDVATLRYAMSGLDETAETADDYDLVLSYAGLTDGCDIVLRFDDTKTGFAFCSVEATAIDDPPADPPTHMAITSGEVFFNTGLNWFFSSKLRFFIGDDR